MKRSISIIIVFVALIYSCTNTVENDNQNVDTNKQAETNKIVDNMDSTAIEIEKVTEDIKESSDELDKLLKEL